MRFSFVPFLLLAVPLTEIAAFVVIGGQIGVWATLGMVLLTAVIGSFLLRWQGVGLFNRISGELRANRMPGRELIHGVMILVAGVLLLTPGFVTDTLGFLLFIPAVRDAVWRLISSRITFQTMSAASAGGRRGRAGEPEEGVVDLEEGEFQRQTDHSSPWKSASGKLPGRDDTDSGGASGL